MANWKEYELGDVCCRLSSGKNISSKKILDKGKYPVYGGNGIRGYCEEANFNGECAIIGRQGAYCGNVRYYSGEAYMTEHAVVVCAKPEHNTHFLAYLLSTMNLGRLSGQSAQPGLSVKTLSKEHVRMPELEIQNKVVDILSSLDNCVSHNETVNQLLNEELQVIFKEWFIDNAEAGAWEKEKLSQLVESTLGGDWGKETLTGNYTEQVYCIRGADIPEVVAGNKGKMPTRFILQKNYQNKKLVDGDLVVEISGGSPTQSTGRVALITQSLLDRYDKGMVCTNFCRAIKPKNKYSMYLYFMWLYLYESRVFFSYENGTTGIKNLDLNGFLENEEYSVPPLPLIEKFNTICASSFKLLFCNGLESEKMETVRDALISKLVTGEIDLSDVSI